VSADTITFSGSEHCCTAADRNSPDSVLLPFDHKAGEDPFASLFDAGEEHAPRNLERAMLRSSVRRSNGDHTETE
jgi:hypothetical protein